MTTLAPPAPAETGRFPVRCNTPSPAPSSASGNAVRQWPCRAHALHCMVAGPREATGGAAAFPEALTCGGWGQGRCSRCWACRSRTCTGACHTTDGAIGGRSRAGGGGGTRFCASRPTPLGRSAKSAHSAALNSYSALMARPAEDVLCRGTTTKDFGGVLRSLREFGRGGRGPGWRTCCRSPARAQSRPWVHAC